MKKIIVLPRRNMESFIASAENPIGTEWKKSNKWAYISIYSEKPISTEINTGEILSKMGCDDYLFLKFDDLTREQFQRVSDPKFILFNRNHAKQILNFAEKIKDVETLIVQCAAGISRSGAVGLFLNRYFKLDEWEFRQTNKNIQPNYYVIDILSEVSGLKVSYEEFWKMQNGVLIPVLTDADRKFLLDGKIF